MLSPVFMFNSQTLMLNTKSRYKVRSFQMENLMDVLGARRINTMKNDLVIEMCGGKKGVNVEKMKVY